MQSCLAYAVSILTQASVSSFRLDIANNKADKLRPIISGIKSILIEDLGPERGEKYSIKGTPLQGLAIKTPKKKIEINDKKLSDLTTVKGVVRKKPKN